jgi:predicted PurR-regulated permease PerM
MNRTLRILGGILVAAIVIYLVWRFSSIVIYVFISVILSLIGRPLVRRFSMLRIGKIHFPKSISALFALLIILIVVLSFFGIFVPLIAKQAAVISNIDFNMLGKSIQEPIQHIESFLKSYNVLTEEETIKQILTDQVESLLDFTSFSSTLGSIVGVTGSIFIATFSILFLTYFFMKDSFLLDEFVENLTPVKFQTEIQNILSTSRHLLRRYFVGLLIELSSMITLLSIGLTIFNVKNALLIGFFGGIMNVIPYLGPVIGAIVGVLLAVTTSLSYGEYAETVPLIFIVLGVFASANLIDNIVLQPLIYSNSVKAHPVEIFLVILIAGSMAGIPGMILAIPSYTVLRIIAKEFLSQLKVVQKLTKNI